MDCTQWYKKRIEGGFAKFSKITCISELRQSIEHRLYSGTTFGTNLKVEHAFTIFLHATICALMYYDFGHNEISFFAALLYACNPINNQTSIWLNGRRYALNIILVLLMMAFPLASPAFYLFTGFLQVTAIFSPILLVNKSPWFLLMIPILLALGWNQIKVKCDVRSKNMANGDLKIWKWTRLIVIVKTFGFFFWKMLFPQVCAMQYPDRIKWGLTKEGTKDAYRFDRSFYLGLFSFVIFGSFFYVSPNNFKPYAAFLFVSTLQWSAVLPITQILSDRYCSLPNVFMMFFLSYILVTYMHLYGVILIFAYILYYIVCLQVVKPMYVNLVDWYNYHFSYFPHLSWYRHNLIQDLMNEGSTELAALQLKEGLKHDAKDYRLLMWGVVMCVNKGDLANAEVFLNEAENNLYLERENEQLGEIRYMREQIKKATPIMNKINNMTGREKKAFIRKKKF